jgi:hypothetical protein
MNYAWQGDMFDDDRPYLQIFEGLAPGADRIIAIPHTMEAPWPWRGQPQLGRYKRLILPVGPVLCRETSHGHRALDHH